MDRPHLRINLSDFVSEGSLLTGRFKEEYLEIESKADSSVELIYNVSPKNMWSVASRVIAVLLPKEVETNGGKR